MSEPIKVDAPAPRAVPSAAPPAVPATGTTDPNAPPIAPPISGSASSKPVSALSSITIPPTSVSKLDFSLDITSYKLSPALLIFSWLDRYGLLSVIAWVFSKYVLALASFSSLVSPSIEI